MWSPQQRVDETEPLFRAGFRERELRRRTSQYRDIAHIDSIYETTIGISHPITSRAVNSLELYLERQRWWLASVIEQAAREHPIPAELLP